MFRNLRIIIHIQMSYKWIRKVCEFYHNNKATFIDSFQFLSSLLDSLVKSSCKDDFKYLSQEFKNNVLDLVKLKRFYSHEYMWFWKV